MVFIERRIFPDFLSKQVLLLQKTESVLTKCLQYYGNILYSIETWSVSNIYRSEILTIVWLIYLQKFSVWLFGN